MITMKPPFYRALQIFFLCNLTFGAQAQETKPLWEAGVFAAGFKTPEYPAADQQQTNAIAAPYFVYRGEVFRVGDGAAARAVALETDWIELDLSLDASFNADSNDNITRARMPDLDYLFELGPQIKLRLASLDFKQRGQAKISLDIQARAAFSTDFSNFDHRGYVFHPELSYQHRNIFGENTAVSISVSPILASEKLHDYFYQVDEQFETDNRAAYQADGGYLGTELNISGSFMATDDIRLFVFGQFNFHGGAENADSPLFRDSTTYAVGLGMSWRLYQSDKKVSGR